MSTSSIEMEPEQNDGLTNSSPKERNVSDNRVRLNTEEDEDINYPWTDYLLNEESDEKSSIDIQQNGRNIQYNDVTICENDNSSVNSGTDGGNSDIDALTDFSDDDEYFIDRANRLYVECYNDWCEGMTPMTYTLPLRESRRRRCEVRRKNETEIEETIGLISDWGFQTDEESPKSEPTVQPGTVDDGDVPPVEDRIDDRGRRTRIGSDKDISSDTDSNLFDRPVTESATAWAGRYSHGPDGEYWKNFAYPMTIGLKRLARDYRNITEYKYSLVVKELARGMMRDWAEERARPVEQHAGCRIPDCQCDGRIEIMEWDPEDMTESDDSNYEETEIRESISGISDQGCRTDEESPSPDQTIELVTAGDNVYTATLGDDKDTYRHNELTRLTGCGVYSSTNGQWEIVDRPVTESVVARSRSETDFSRGEHFYLVNRPVTEPMAARDASDTNFPSSVHSDLVDRPVTESVTTRSETDIDFFGEESELVNRPITGSVTTREGSGTDSPEEEHSLMVNRPVTELVTTRHGSDTDFLNSKHSDFADRLVMRSVSILVRKKYRP